jgi:hypothetical protein
LKATGWVPNAHKVAQRSEVALIPHVFQYEESLMQRFDLNKDGIFSDKEVDQAFPIYKTLIKKFSKSDKETVNKAVFDYLLLNGKVPCGLKDILGLVWKIWRNEPIGVAADREKLAGVFGAIADAANGTSTCSKTESLAESLDPSLPPSSEPVTPSTF